MFDIGWTEIMVIVSVAIIVVGPKDLPRMLRTVGQTIGKVRRMSRDFQSTFTDAIREAEKQADIADMKQQVESVGNLNPLGDLKKSIEDDKTKIADKAPPKPLMPTPEATEAPQETASEAPVVEKTAAADSVKKPAKPAKTSKPATARKPRKAAAPKKTAAKAAAAGGTSTKTKASSEATKTAEETKA
ncbi:MAG: twin-arginine translocase subunit TatB [Rhodobacteraceae bacterium]|nr:twin-arginine translocase subunit TatB [Paracoccaceae bacterium]